MTEDVQPMPVDELESGSHVKTERMSVSTRKFSVNTAGKFSDRKSITASIARSHKLAQYYRLSPSIFPRQAFCFAACLLKWYHLEGLRLAAVSAMPTKDKHSRPTASVAVTLDKIPPLDRVESKNESDEEDEDEVHPSEATLIQNMLEGEPTEADFEGVRPNDLAPYGIINKTPLVKINYATGTEKRFALILLYNTIKYSSILDKLLEEVRFFEENPDMEEESSLVNVLCYDYAMRHFQKRTEVADEREMPEPENRQEFLVNGRLVLYPAGSEMFEEVDSVVASMCVRLNAAVARTRVRSQVGSLRLLLPEEWRKAEQFAETMPVYGWYNQLLGKQDIVTGWLKENGFRRIMTGRSPQPSEYTSDKHCSDVFIFNKADLNLIMESEIAKQKNLILQDKSTCLLVHTVLANVGSGEEVMFVNCINALSSVHMEGLIICKYPMVQPVPQIRCMRQSREDEDSRLLTKMGSKVVKATNEEFLSQEISGDKNRFLRHIIIEASDSRSGVVHPVLFLEVEKEDLNFLRDKCALPNNPQRETRKAEHIARTSSLLRHALKFAGVRTVTVLSHAEEADETDSMISRVVEAANKLTIREAEAMATSSRAPQSATIFGLQVPTFAGLAEEWEAFNADKPSIITREKTIRIPASGETNGFVIFTLGKEAVLLKNLEESRPADDTQQQPKESKAKGKKKSKLVP